MQIPTDPAQEVDKFTAICEVCGGEPPPGHRFCDNCWPEAAIQAGKAARCALCGAPKVIEKLYPLSGESSKLVCAAHL